MKLLAFAFAALVACGGSQKEVAVQGSDMDLARVAGDWEGEYKGTESGRTGPVTFSLQVGSHTAEGQVAMSGQTPLKIEFVKVKQNDVKGTIAPYTDPSCSCEVETTFLGTLGDNVINGTFETKVSKTGQIQTGTWTVSRKQ
ncbi:MAG TPA: hypothetical protein VIV40_29465 [Kofleriaceae bacterium]